MQKKTRTELTLALDTSATFSHTPPINTLSLHRDLIQHWLSLDGVVSHRMDHDETLQFPLKHYQEVVRSLARYHPQLKVNGIAKPTLGEGNTPSHAHLTISYRYVFLALAGAFCATGIGGEAQC